MKNDRRDIMGADRFRQLLASYGAEISRWPEAERPAAQAFLASSNEASHWLDEARSLDMLLDAVPELAPSPDLLRRVAEVPLRHAAPARAAAALTFGRARNWIAGALAAAALGAIVGVVTPEPDRELTDFAQSTDDLSPLSWAGELADEFDEELAP